MLNNKPEGLKELIFIRNNEVYKNANTINNCGIQFQLDRNKIYFSQLVNKMSLKITCPLFESKFIVDIFRQDK